MFSKKAFAFAILSLALSVAAKKDETCAASGAKTVTVTHTVSAAAATGSSVFAANPAAGKGFGGKGGNNAATGKGTGAATGKGTGAATGKGAATGAGKGAATGAGKGTAAAGNNAGSGAAAGNNAGAAAAANAGAQSSLTLVQSVIATGFQNNGQQPPVTGQVASLTSSNNFINFCATVPQFPITNGAQVKTGSCNPAPMGLIAPTTAMPSSKFVNPKNLATIPANTNFTIQMAIKNLETGHFTNAQANYFAAPQQLNAQNTIQGHSHVVIEAIPSLDTTQVTDPNKFAFFKGLNDKAVNGVLSVEVGGGLPAGFYRMASINAAANHQPALVAIAQHGSLDDMVYFTVSNNGAAAGAGAGAGAAKGAGATKGAGAAKGGNAAASGAAANSAAAQKAAAAQQASAIQQITAAQQKAAAQRNAAAKAAAAKNGKAKRFGKSRL